MYLSLKRRLGTGVSYAIPVLLALLALQAPSGVAGLLGIGVIVSAVGRAKVEAMLWDWWAPFGICLACHHTIPLVARWKCGCAYLPPKPRHAFGRCRLCQKGFRTLTCPACEGSILI